MLLNNVLNIDCVKGMSELPDQSIDLIIADPPYGIAKKKPLNGNSHGKIKTLHSDWDIFSSFDEFLNFYRLWISPGYSESFSSFLTEPVFSSCHLYAGHHLAKTHIAAKLIPSETRTLGFDDVFGSRHLIGWIAYAHLLNTYLTCDHAFS